MLPSPDQLLRQIDQAMIADQPRLRDRIAALRGNSTGDDAVRRLAAQVQDSVSRCARRMERRPRPTFAADLPVIARREEISQAIQRHQVVVVCGETGSGKTTQLPQICLEMGRGAAGLIGHTQPRRIAARTVAQRIADELGAPLGPRGPAGYKVRFGDETSDQNFIKLMTDGILLAETQQDRDLLAYDTLIIDEAHERSLNIDFLLGYLRQLLPRRPDLKVIVTSATIDPQRLSAHFGGPAVAPVVEVSGRTFPVEIRYRPTTDLEAEDWENIEEVAICDAVDELSRRDLPRGDILVFLPGEREIRNTAEALRKHCSSAGAAGAVEILPLYARLSPAEQMRVFAPQRGGAGRRVVLATNVAETSLTVPGIRYVIDAGLARISRYNHRTKVQRLPIEPISQASANQRSGRCGRVAAGVAIRLYAEDDFKTRPAFTDPEILRTNLASVILQMKSLRLGPVEEFPFVEPPDARMIRDGYETLEELGAIDDRGELTRTGRELARIPVDPRIGRILLAAGNEACLAEALIICSALEVQDPRDRPMDKQAAADQAQARFRSDQSDFLTYLTIWDAYHQQKDDLTHSRLRAWCRESFLNYMRMREWVETYQQLRGIVTEMGMQTNAKPATYDQLHRALLTGLLSNIAAKNEAGGGFDYNGARSTKVSIFPGSGLFKKGPRWFVAAEIVQTTKLYARTIAKIEPAWIEELGAHVLKRSYTDPHWNSDGGHAAAWERITVFGLVLVPRRRVNYGPIDAQASRALFIHHVLVEGDWPPGHVETPFETHNRAVIDEVQRLEAKLRRSDILADRAALEVFYDQRVPPHVRSVGDFEQWRKDAERQNPRALFMSVDDVLARDPSIGAVAAAFPDQWLSSDPSPPARRAGPDGPSAADGIGAPEGTNGSPPSPHPSAPAAPSAMRLQYAFEPGKDHDGVTLVVPLTQLAQVDDARCEWLVPGMLREKVLGLIKALPKQYRAQLGDSGDGKAGVASLAAECAGVMTFGQGPLGAALSEAVEVLRGVKIPPEAWSAKGLPDHLRMNIRVIDDHEKPVGESRDVAAIKSRLAGRARKALAGAARARFAREGLTAWDFGDLPERLEFEHAGATTIGYPAVADRGDAAALTLAESPETAAALTHAGVRRLLALACREELAHRLRSLPGIDAMYKWYAPVGEPAELKSTLIDLVVEKAFLTGQPDIRTREAFEDRQTACWGRLGQVTIEVAGLVARVLETRHKISARLGSGTPRTWAVSVADIREHAAYLMPRGFLKLVPMERLREYPRYVEAMWLRLTKLREDGSPREARALAEMAPHWKRFTAWVAHAAAEAKAREDHAEPPAQPVAGEAGKGKPRSAQPLPAARRAAPVVPTEAAAWAMRPGSLPPQIAAYRWMLEEFRVSLFAQELGTAQTVSGKRLDEQWAKGAAP